MQAHTLNLPRRCFMTGLGAAAAKSLLPVGAVAAGDPAAPDYRNAVELVQALATQQISARELLDAAITRIDAVDPKIHAVVVRDFDRARAAADAADAALKTRRASPAARLADDGEGAVQRRRADHNVGLPAVPELAARYRCRSLCSGSRRLARSLSARPMSRQVSRTGRVPMRSTAPPITRGTSVALPADPRAVPRRRSPPGSCRWSSARTLGARFAHQPISAACSLTSRASTLSRSAARDRLRRRPFRSGAIWRWLVRWRAVRPTLRLN